MDAAKATGIQHFVWSTLEHEQHAPHFETKAQIDDYLKVSGVPRTSLYTSSYFENILGPHFGLKKDPELDGGIVLDTNMWSEGYLPMISARDIGAWAVAAFKTPEKWIGESSIRRQ